MALTKALYECNFNLFGGEHTMAIKTNLRRSILSLAIIFFIVFNIFTGLSEFSFGQSGNTVDLHIKATSDKGEIPKGAKGVDHNLSYIKLTFDKNFSLSDPDRINNIGIIQNGNPLQLNNYENYMPTA